MVKTVVSRAVRVFLAIVVLIYFLSLSFIFRKEIGLFDIYYVPSSSMSPTLLPGDVVFVALGNQIEIGEVIVFTASDNDVYVKRVVETSDDGVFVAGDNKTLSRGSNYFGEIAFDNIAGKAQIVLFNTNATSVRSRLLKKIN
jgi:signal peptidase I